MNRLKKILKWTGIVLGVLVAILLIGNAWFVWTTGARLERQLAAIRQAGDPLSIADLAPKPIPPEKNAATFLRRAKADVEAIDNELRDVRETTQYDLRRRLSLENQRRIKSALEAYAKAVPLLEHAASCPDYDANLNCSLPEREFRHQLLEVVHDFRSPMRVLAAKAQLLVNEGNRDEGVRVTLAIFRLSRHSDRAPCLINYLVSLTARNIATEPANFALQTGPVSPKVRDALEAELALQERMAAHVWALKSERAFGLDSFRTFRRRNFWLVSRAFWNKQESDYLDALQAFLALADKPMSYQQDVQGIQKTLARLGVFARQSAVEMDVTHTSVTRTRAMVRCLRVLNALQAHTSAEGDKVPKLSELGLPVEATADPYTGEPLHIKKRPQGWLVYSVGKNYRDDGGKLDDNTDVGVGPPLPATKQSED